VSEAPSDKTTEVPQRQATIGRGVLDVLLYSAARLLLVVVITAAIFGIARLIGVTDFPLVVAALGGLIVSMPLGMWVFAPLRRRATATLAVAGERRRSERDHLRARLRGDAASAAEPEPGSNDA
jgi:uncharacterized RDD family membrane protein YckC